MKRKWARRYRGQALAGCALLMLTLNSPAAFAARSLFKVPAGPHLLPSKAVQLALNIRLKRTPMINEKFDQNDEKT